MESRIDIAVALNAENGLRSRGAGSVASSMFCAAATTGANATIAAIAQCRRRRETRDG
jgi:hypothetical protein